MAKSLGQIHTVSDSFQQPAAAGTVPRRFDLAGKLTDKLQKMVRQGNYFKLVGVDVSISPQIAGVGNGGTISGYFRYYNPTKGRCAAFRHAFKSMADQMKMQGIAMRDNAGYDFRVGLSNTSGTGPIVLNQATLDGTNGLYLYDPGNLGQSIFDVYNKSVLPTLTNVPAGQLFDEGFNTLLQSRTGGTDFVLNDVALYQGNDDYADTSYEQIPFQLAYGANSSGTISVEWRPDPALYVAVLTGNLEMVVEDCQITGGAGALDVNVDFHIAGWKSIMGNPDKKKKSGRRSKKKR